MASPRSDTSSETEKGAVRLRSTWGSTAAGFRAPTLSEVQGTSHRHSGCHLPPARVRAPLAPRSTRIFTKSPPESRPLHSRTRLDASPPRALGRWAGSSARNDTEGSPGTARPAGLTRHAARVRSLSPQQWDAPAWNRGSGGLRRRLVWGPGVLSWGALVREWNKEVRQLRFSVQLLVTLNCLLSPHSFKNPPY